MMYNSSMLDFIGNIINTVVTEPILNLLLILYKLLFSNLGLAVMVLAIIVRLLLVPLYRNQVVMQKKMVQLKPRLEKLKDKYKNDPQKMAQAQMQLYQEIGYNPLGCFVNLIPQIVVLWVIISVIRAVTANNFDGIYSFVQTNIFNGTLPTHLNTNFLGVDIAQNFKFILDNNGIASPQSAVFIIMAVLVGVLQYISTKMLQVSNKATVEESKGNPNSSKNKKKAEKNKANGEQPDQAELQSQIEQSLSTALPISAAFFTLSTPGILGVYWVAQSVALILQQFIIDPKQSKQFFKDIKFLKSKNE